VNVTSVSARPKPVSRIRLVAGWSALFAVALIALSGGRQASADSVAVSIDGFAFSPASVSVSVGDAVNWTNAQPGVVHTVTADDGSFDSGRLSTGQSFAMTFAVAGAVAYHCAIHPTMHGAVVVSGAGASNLAGPASAGGRASGRAITLRAGYNLVGPPGGTNFGDATAFTFDARANAYRQLDPGELTQPGLGYWVLATADTTLPLDGGSNGSAILVAAAGAWQLIGNPSGTLPAAVTGADAEFTYDPAAGAYSAALLLQPGQGAWAMSKAGGSLQIVPGGTLDTPTPSPTSAAAAPAVRTPTPYVPTPRPAMPPATQPTAMPMPMPYPYPRPY